MTYLWPIAVGYVAMAWWYWIRDSAPYLPKWRSLLFLSGLLASSLNVLMFGLCLIYWWKAQNSPGFSKVKETCDNISTYLVLFALIGAVLGRGPKRSMLGYSAVLGFMQWVPVAVL